MKLERSLAFRRFLALGLVFLLSALTSEGAGFGFVEIPEGVVDVELRSEVEAMVMELSNQHDIALGVIVLEGVTRDEALAVAAKVRNEEQFLDLSIHLVLSTAGPGNDGHLVRINLMDPQDEKALVQPFFNAFGRCREQKLDDRLRQLLAEVSDQVELFVLQRRHGQEKYATKQPSETESTVNKIEAADDLRSEIWPLIMAAVCGLLLIVFVIALLMKSVNPKVLRFAPVKISPRLQAPFTGGSSYLVSFKKKRRR